MGAKKLLVADDSLTIQKVIRLALTNDGYEIHAVSDGKDACEQIALIKPDVVLIDISLPEQSAFDVRDKINQTDDRGTKFILMSTAFEQVDESKYNSLNFHGRLIKPFDPAHLRQVLGDVLGVSASTPAEPVATEPVMPPPPTQVEEISAPPPQSEIPEIPESGDFQFDPPEPPEEKTLELEDDRTAETTAPKMSSDLWEKEAVPPPPPAQDSDSDIKQLTESTIKMSGLDDYNWNVSDSGSKDFVDEKTIQITDTDPSMKPPENMLGSVPQPEPGSIESVSITTSEPPADGNVELMVSKQVEATLERLAHKLLPDIAERVIREEIHKMLANPPSEQG